MTDTERIANEVYDRHMPPKPQPGIVPSYGALALFVLQVIALGVLGWLVIAILCLF